MINQSAFELCAAQLSGTVCPDCGGFHEVSLRFDNRGVAFFSVDESGKSCEGFKRMVINRFSTCTNRDPKAELMLRRFLGDPSLD